MSAVPTEVVLHVLWHLGDRIRGQVPDSFTIHLLRAIASADETQRAQLALIFDDYVLAYTIGIADDGINTLRAFAAAEMATP